MADSNPNDELSKVARSLALSTNVYADALASISKQTASIDAISRAVTQQMNTKRTLLGSTDAILKQINRRNAISPSIQSIFSANSSLTRMADRISVADTASMKVSEDQKRIQDMIKRIRLTDSITASFARIDTTRMLSASLAASMKVSEDQKRIQDMIKGARFTDSITASFAQIDTTRMLSASLAASMKVSEDQKRIQDMIKGARFTDSITASFARIDTTRMLSASLAAQTKLASFDNLALGRIAGIDEAFSKALTINIGNLTRSYQALIDVAATRDSLAHRLPFITTYPPVEYYREIDVLETITVEEDANETATEPINNAINGTLPSVDDLLADFDGRLCQLLHGARQSLQNDNPDRARHVITSVRELFTQVLHALAPDDDIRRWTTSPELFHNNRPTRRARFLFICRNINCDPLSRFVEDDVRAALSFVDSLNSGTHVVESKLTLVQLGAIVSRIESYLVFLLQLRGQ